MIISTLTFPPDARDRAGRSTPQSRPLGAEPGATAGSRPRRPARALLGCELPSRPPPCCCKPSGGLFILGAPRSQVSKPKQRRGLRWDLKESQRGSNSLPGAGSRLQGPDGSFQGKGHSRSAALPAGCGTELTTHSCASSARPSPPTLQLRPSFSCSPVSPAQTREAAEPGGRQPSGLTPNPASQGARDWWRAPPQSLCPCHPTP